MSLRLIYGRAGSGKTHFCLEDIKSRIDSGDNKHIVLIIPEQFSLQTERNIIKTLGKGGIMKPDVLSFRRLAYRVFNEVGGLTRRHISPAGRSMLICRIIDQISDRLEVFKNSAKHHGFINTISTAISEFKRYNITPGLLRDSAIKLSSDDHAEETPEHNLLYGKLNELAEIYDEFENTLHCSYMDADDDLTVLYSRLDKSKQFDNSEIWIDEFSGFTPQEYGIIEKLLLKAERINICLCTDCLFDEKPNAGIDVFLTVKTTAAKLVKIAHQNNIEVEKPVFLNPQPSYRFKDCEELLHLEKYYFSFPHAVFKGSTQIISIYTAANMYSEVESTARDIIKLCRDEGRRYREIAVVTRNLEGYHKLVSSIFSEYGIPFFIDLKSDISNHPLVRLIFACLDIFSSNWSYEPIFRYLKTGLTNISRDDIDVLENYVLACGIRGRRWTQNEDWNFRLLSADTKTDMSIYEKELTYRINEVRRTFTKPLEEFRAKIGSRTKVYDLCKALFEFLCSIEVHEKVNSLVDAFRKEGELNTANEYSRIWNMVIEVLDQLVEVAGSEEVKLDRFKMLLETGFEESKAGMLPPSLDQVMVGSVERTKNYGIDALYILGVNDGIFPASSWEEGLLSDRDRETMRDLGVELAPDTRSKVFEEQYMIYTALTTAGKYLRLSYSVSDQDGKVMRPSSILSRIHRIIPQVKEAGDIGNIPDETGLPASIAAPVPTFNEMVAVMRKHVDGRKVNTVWKDVYRWYLSQEKWKFKCSNAALGLKYSNATGIITPQKVRKLYGSPLYSTVSRLENYVSCPFSFFIKYGLKAGERKMYKLSAPDIGTFLHDAIERFSRRIKENGISWRTIDSEWCSSSVSVIVDDMLAEYSQSIFNSSERYRYQAQRLKRILTRTVGIISEHIKRSSFEPYEYEVAFGDNEKFKPINVLLPSGESMRLVGRIDRIDAMKNDDGTYIRIIDYKSGRKAFKLSDVYHGLQMQLIAYLSAILEVSGSIEGAVIPAGMLYFSIDDPFVKGGKEFSDEQIETEIMKQLKMKGLLLADAKLIKEMDRSIDGDSIIIPARINKGGELGRSSAASIKQFEALRGHVKEMLVQIGNEVLNGDVSIKPYKKKNISSCMYCSYLPVCQFDPALKDNKYRVLEDLKDDEVWKKIADIDSEDGI